METMEGKSQSYETRIFDFENKILFLSVNTAPIIKNGKVVGTISFGRDITEQKKIQEDQLKSSKLESIGILAGGIAHDFNNILTSVIGNISLAKLYSKPEDRVFRPLEKAEKSSMQAQKLTLQLLTFARGGTPIKRTTHTGDLIKNFTIYLPASEKEAPVEIENNMKEELIKGKGKILMMDDEKVVRDVSGEILEYMGYTVKYAEEGGKAVELYKEAEKTGQSFDAVILDLTVPGGMGGEETIKKLFEINPEVKVIVSSGYSDSPIMSNFREYGFSGVISKPYKIQELSEILNRVIKNAEK